jgi:hypothetical protein
MNGGHMPGTGDDEIESVNGNEVEAVGDHRFETPESRQRHADLLKEGPRDAGAAQGIGEDGIDITESDGPYLEGGLE